jgi:hypothetical protein
VPSETLVVMLLLAQGTRTAFCGKVRYVTVRIVPQAILLALAHHDE